MSKKLLVIVGLAIAIAVSGGVVALNSGSSGSSGASSLTEESGVDDHGDEVLEDDAVDESSDEAVDEESDVDSDTDAEPDLEEASESASSSSPAPVSADATVEPSVPIEEQILAKSLSIQFVVDHSTGVEASPRVVFGESCDVCYITFFDDQTFEMCIDPASGSTQTGTYRIIGDLVSVTYLDGKSSDYTILADESGNLTHVIVNYGDYDVYFG